MLSLPRQVSLFSLGYLFYLYLSCTSLSKHGKGKQIKKQIMPSCLQWMAVQQHVLAPRCPLNNPNDVFFCQSHNPNVKVFEPEDPL